MQPRKFRRFTIHIQDQGIEAEVRLSLEELKLLYLHAAEAVENIYQEEGPSFLFNSAIRQAVLKVGNIIDNLEKLHYE